MTSLRSIEALLHGRIRAALSLPHPRAVISYPKSGRTWLRVMLDELGIRARYLHAGSSHGSARPLSELTIDPSFRRGVLLLRDPRDTVVSGFHEATIRLQTLYEKEGYSGPISAFIRDPQYGIEKCAKFNLMWSEHAWRAENMMITSYEAMHCDAAAELRRILAFFGRPRSDAIIEEVVRRNAFDLMQSREREGTYSRYKRRLKPGDLGDINSYKVRRGKVGGYKDELSDGDIHYCNSLLERLGYFEQIADGPPSSGTASQVPQNS